MKQSPSTWKDPKTGLEWQYESPGEMTWYEALEHAKSLSLGGKDDWRIPTVLELDTLLDRNTLLIKCALICAKKFPFGTPCHIGHHQPSINIQTAPGL